VLGNASSSIGRIDYDSTQMNLTYLDNNATTRPARQVVEATLRCMEEAWGNPSSAHRFGQLARKMMDDARSSVSALLGCAEAELLFTSGATESVNTAIRSMLASRSPRKKILTTAVEHSATRELCEQLSREGFEVIQIPVDSLGRLDLERLASSVSDDVALMTLLWANNETGVIFPIQSVVEICKAARVPVHSDVTQCVGRVRVDLKTIGLDAASFSSHKFHGPKGVGGLYTRRGLRLRPLTIGGPQERGRRGGTENVIGIVGMGVAARLAIEGVEDMQRVAKLRDDLEQRIVMGIELCRVNGDVANRLPNTTNISFERLEAEPILLLLSEQGICASAGAACSSGSLEPSHVLKAMGLSDVWSHGAIRLSLSVQTTSQEIDRCVEILPRVISKLRQVLPVAV